MFGVGFEKQGNGNVGLKVIGSGLGRTGTLSTKLALEQLGFAPCHHMVEVHEPDVGSAVDCRSEW